jgi:light-regulated signal transduction histidine kinase (bacteriophytochrome)
MLEQKVKERTAELEKTNFELIQFTSVASHDLKEPVRKVSIFSQRSKDLARDFNNPQFHEYMDNVIRSSKRMALLIDDLLNFARLSQARVDFQPVDLNVLLNHIKDDLQLTISEKKATIIHCDLPIVQGVELQLGQVFQNLISNSIKFAHPDRHPEIRIECEKEGANYLINYFDNGIGFENEMAEKIFDIFERLHPRDQYEGTGIGLAIVKKILASHGGSISAVGFPGEGAKFEIRIPCEDSVSRKQSASY